VPASPWYVLKYSTSSSQPLPFSMRPRTARRGCGSCAAPERGAAALCRPPVPDSLGRRRRVALGRRRRLFRCGAVPLVALLGRSMPQPTVSSATARIGKLPSGTAARPRCCSDGRPQREHLAVDPEVDGRLVVRGRTRMLFSGATDSPRTVGVEIREEMSASYDRWRPFEVLDERRHHAPAARALHLVVPRVRVAEYPLGVPVERLDVRGARSRPAHRHAPDAVGPVGVLVGPRDVVAAQVVRTSTSWRSASRSAMRRQWYSTREDLDPYRWMTKAIS